MKQSKMIKAPCETCLYKNGTECFSVLALLKAARAMELELYNHGVENLISNFTLPCKNYVNESKYLQNQYKRIV